MYITITKFSEYAVSVVIPLLHTVAALKCGC